MRNPTRRRLEWAPNRWQVTPDARDVPANREPRMDRVRSRAALDGSEPAATPGLLREEIEQLGAEGVQLLLLEGDPMRPRRLEAGRWTS